MLFERSMPYILGLDMPLGRPRWRVERGDYMEHSVTSRGRYETGFGYASGAGNWEQICADHEIEFPHIYSCERGTFNIALGREGGYRPPLHVG